MAKDASQNPPIVAEPYLDLRDQRRTDVDLADTFLKRPKFDDATLDGTTDLTSTTIRGGSAKRTRFAKIIAEGSIWTGISMPNAQLIDAEFQSADFTECVLTGVNATGIQIASATFERCDLRGAIAIDAHARGASFTNSDLRHVNAARADLTNASFVGSRVAGMIVTGADLTNAELSPDQLASTVGWEHNGTIAPALRTGALLVKAERSLDRALER